MAAEVRWLLLVSAIILAIARGNDGSAPHRRFEYKYSFKPPYLAQKDGSVPFWQYGGNAIASEENVRIAPSLRSQKGGIWSKEKTSFDWWEAEVTFRVTGRGRVGADGLAFWYSETPGGHDGPVFGSADQWNGLGVIFDSFDNDNKHNNPYIMAIHNDGTKVFDHQNDGSTQLLAGCLRDFRNKPFPTKAKIEYYQHVLTVHFHSGMTNNDEDYEVCIRAENVVLPKYGHFGLTAATGGLADDHDALSFLTTSLHVPGQSPPTIPLPIDADQEKLAHEYEEYQKKLDKQREDYRREHPEDHQGEGEEYETEQDRELRQIFSGQSQMFAELRDMGRKLSEIVGRQESTISLLSQVHTVVSGGGIPVIGQNGQAVPPQHAQVPPQVGAQPVMARHEVDALLTQQRELVNTARELKTYLVELHQRTSAIQQAQEKQGTAHVVGGAYDQQQLAAELRDGLNSVKRDMAAAAQRLSAPPPPCPTVSGCVSTTVFITVAVVQLFVLLGYSLYRDSKESQAKKFY
ncbi:protein ERGIC-53 [Cloeon dipterum]|uniref:protein ERGIC-53 n=1 Tax=Cloeon dipterum TaxID=197152 RepID=UPI0032208050